MLKKVPNTIIFLIATLVIIMIGYVMKDNAKAGSPHNISGWAWSDNIGWLSFNCNNEALCGSVDYGVDMANDGTLSGYAWSNNIGWVSFNQSELSGCPSSPCIASVDPTTGAMSGWIKALSADGNGWDGWVSLSGSSPNYGPILNNNDVNNRIFEGYGWGSNVFGWVTFNSYIGYEAKLAVPICNNNGVCEAGLGEDTTSCLADCIVEDFTLSNSGDWNISFVSGVGASSGTTTISIVPISGFQNSVSLSVSNIKNPSGQTVSASSLGMSFYFSDTTLSYSGGSYETTGVSVNVSNSITAGGYTITITGIGAGLSRTLTLPLSVDNVSPGYKEF